jgi:hypothetical protein
LLVLLWGLLLDVHRGVDGTAVTRLGERRFAPVKISYELQLSRIGIVVVVTIPMFAVSTAAIPPARRLRWRWMSWVKAWRMHALSCLIVSRIIILRLIQLVWALTGRTRIIACNLQS